MTTEKKRNGKKSIVNVSDTRELVHLLYGVLQVGQLTAKLISHLLSQTLTQH